MGENAINLGNGNTEARNGKSKTLNVKEDTRKSEMENPNIIHKG